VKYAISIKYFGCFPSEDLPRKMQTVTIEKRSGKGHIDAELGKT